MSADETRVVKTAVLQQIREDLADLGAEITSLRQQLAAVVAERDEAQDALTAALRERDDARGERDLLAAHAGEAQRSDAAESDLQEAYADRDDARAERDEARAELEEAQAELEEARAERDETRDERDEALRQATDAERVLRDAQAALDRLQRERDDLFRTHPMPPARPGGRPRPASGAPAERVATAFVAWCARSSALRSRPYLFETFAREATGLPLLEVEAVFASGSAFAPSGPGPEYWRVGADGEEFLLPQPVRDDAFTDLAPEAYEGTATPATLARIRLAVLRDHGDGLRVHEPGRLHAER